MVLRACSPATREAEAGNSLEPERWRLQGAEIAPSQDCTTALQLGKTPSQNNNHHKPKTFSIKMLKSYLHIYFVKNF